MLEAGVAKIKITPPPGLELAGYGVYLNRTAKEIHDDLFARALLFDDGKTKTLLIVCDLCGVGRQFVMECRREISGATGIPEGNISISCTHTHSGPVTVFLRGWGEMNRDYMKFLKEKIVEAAIKANENLEPAAAGAGRGKIEIGYNRVVKDGPVDTEIMVLRVDDIRGRTKAVLCNYSAHAVVGGPGNLAVSADWPGYASAKIDNALSGGMGIFAQGCCGDVNVKDACSSSFEKMKEYGECLAEEVLCVYKEIKLKKNLKIATNSKIINLPLQVHNQKFIEDVLNRYAEQRKNANWERFFQEWKEDTLREINRNVRDTLPAEVQVFVLGTEILFVMLPGEVFTRWGMEIKKLLPRKNIFVIGYANDFVGYIPDKDDFARHGYAADLVPLICGFLHFSPDVGERLVSGVKVLIEKIHAY